MGGNRTMRRGRLRPGKIITQVIVFLLLVSGGAIVNVAVAWGCALLSDTGQWSRPPTPSAADISWWRDHAPPGFADQPLGVSNSRGVGLTSTMMFEQSFELHGTLGNNVFRDRVGWPLPSLEMSQWADRTARRITNKDSIDSPIWRPSTPGRRQLPIDPLPAGFLLDTVLYAFVLWLALLEAPRRLRRRSRRKHGRCLRCGYHLHGDYVQGCPECGWNRQPEAMA